MQLDWLGDINEPVDKVLNIAVVQCGGQPMLRALTGCLVLKRERHAQQQCPDPIIE